MLRDIAIAPVRGLVLAGLSVLGLIALLAHALVLMLTVSVGLVMLAPWAVDLGRRVTNTRRTLAARWHSVYVPQPYSPPPAPPQPDEEGLYVYDGRLYKTSRVPALYNRIDWMLDDRATWRDFSWLVLNLTVGNVLALAPAAVIVYGAVSVPWLIPLGFLIGPVMLKLHTSGSQALLGPPRRPMRGSISKRLTGWGYSFGLFALSLYSLIVLITFPQAWKAAAIRRNLAGEWSGVPVAKPHTTRTSRREVVFFALDPFVGILLTVVPVTLLIYAGWGLAVPQAWMWFAPSAEPGSIAGWYGQIAGSAWLATPVAIALTLVALWITPPLVRLNGYWVRFLLAPTKEELSLRVRELAQTRAEATDAAAAELRRIERDLHDGAQARIVAMGLGLGALEQLIGQDPARAKELLARVRDNSAKALAELRDLVRGIHPPVLADRGLGDAVRALALDTPLPVKVHVDLPRRLDPPIETAAYFAISEVLTNVTKHASAISVRVTISLREDALELTVWDDGRGGADMSRGTGLRGVARRLSAFDGAMTVDSPVGGPTTVRMTLRVSAG